ncbi:DUF1853 family protein [Chromobacterium violaceum]|uniref:DUF1853 domain-containing protein n=1 Tax=Chromobacterium violaceum TaxID=536 RepID=A0A202BCD8_CHRVL|nr:DUF1853 family protein [Chromobacterium violaceum]OVE49062.1 hypothetical protein CBW21_07590 [Chromobacterium violaceum]SUX88304.1 Domain of uncharacterised function (DUF1853) [Chromobacterium violaceum]
MPTEPGLTLPYAHPAVRDLAFLLTSPSPWRCGADLPPQRLLGLRGEALLARLDRAPAALEAWLAAAPGKRLGKYAERLFSFWFRHAPHIDLIAENLKVINSERRTVGEFDYLLRVDGEPWHLETACKLYLSLGETADDLLGPGLNDAWRLKATKITTQLQLSRHPDALPLLPDGFHDCRTGARICGWFFYPPGRCPPAPLDCGQLRGWLAPLDTDWPRLYENSRWAWLPRLSWLAPALRTAADTEDEASLRARLRGVDAPQMLAELQPAGHGRWREAARGFVSPPGWPDAERLAALRLKIAQA